MSNRTRVRIHLSLNDQYQEIEQVFNRFGLDTTPIADERRRLALALDKIHSQAGYDVEVLSGTRRRYRGGTTSDNREMAREQARLNAVRRACDAEMAAGGTRLLRQASAATGRKLEYLKALSAAFVSAQEHGVDAARVSELADVMELNNYSHLVLRQFLGWFNQDPVLVNNLGPAHMLGLISPAITDSNAPIKYRPFILRALSRLHNPPLRPAGHSSKAYGDRDVRQIAEDVLDGHIDGSLLVKLVDDGHYLHPKVYLDLSNAVANRHWSHKQILQALGRGAPHGLFLEDGRLVNRVGIPHAISYSNNGVPLEYAVSKYSRLPFSRKPDVAGVILQYKQAAMSGQSSKPLRDAAYLGSPEETEPVDAGPRVKARVPCESPVKTPSQDARKPASSPRLIQFTDVPYTDPRKLERLVVELGFRKTVSQGPHVKYERAIDGGKTHVALPKGGTHRFLTISALRRAGVTSEEARQAVARLA